MTISAQHQSLVQNAAPLAGVSRRHVLKVALGSAGMALAAPMINIGRFSLFATAQQDYSARCIDLVRGSLVIDMLFPLSLNGDTQQRWGPSLDGLSDEDIASLEEPYQTKPILGHS